MWLGDCDHDVAQRKARIEALESSNQVYTASECELIESGEALFAQYDSSSAPATQLKCSATISRSETKLDDAGRLLMGRAEVDLWVSPQELVAYMLCYNGRHLNSDFNPATDVRTETLQRVNDHHTIIFNRKRSPGVYDRTFLNSLVAQKMAENPATYMLVAAPILQHPKITAKDEAGAVRAESFRCFRATEVSPGRTKLDYVCSLNLKGFIPQFITNFVAIPAQETTPYPCVACVRMHAPVIRFSAVA